MPRKSLWQYRIKYTVVVVLLLATSCLPYTSPTQTPFVISQLTTPAPSSQPNVTPTETPTKRPHTLTPDPSTIATQRLGTPTAPPTLSANDAKSVILDLLQNNGGCQLPCLWHITPGEADAQALEPFLARFGNVITTNEDTVLHIDRFSNSGGIDLSSYEGDLNFRLSLSYYLIGGELTQLELRAETTNKSDQAAIFGNSRFNQLMNYYLLPQILSTYGQPAQVLVAPFQNDSDYITPLWIPFSLVLFYPDQGILVEYLLPRQTVGDKFLGCPLQSHVVVTVWNPELQLSLAESAQKLSGQGLNALNVDYFRPIEEATGMSLEEFYQSFKDPQNAACLETPVDMWPKP